MSLFKDASLLIVPSAYKAGKIYAVKPTDGTGDLTWTRGSDAWRTNADGLIQRVPWNLFVQSQSFTSASWLSGGSGAGIYTDNFATAPDGTMTASRWTAAGSGYQTRQNVATINSTATLSVWMRSNSGTKTATLFINDGISAFSVISVTTTWQRFVLTANIGGTLSGGGRCGWYSNSVLTTSDYIEVWGAQYVEGSSAQTYFPTTDRLNVPRLSYMYGSCPALLLEPQRTNLALYSDQFNDAYWTKNNATITSNATTAPDGTTTADKLIADNTLSNHQIVKPFTPSTVVYSFSIFAKKAEYKYIRINTGGPSWGGAGFVVDLDNGSITLNNLTETPVVVAMANGWYRITISKLATSTSSIDPQIIGVPTSTGTNTYQGDGTSGIFIWGAQLEIGSYSTTYIPTTSATATRVADSFSRSNIYTNGLITSSGGTWFVELRNNIAYTRDAISTSLGIYDVATTNGFTIKTYGGSAQRVSLVKVIGSETSLYATTTDTVKIVFKWNGSTADVFVNGTKQVSATAFTATQLQTLQTAVNTPMFIQAMALYPTPLSDTDCQTLTTL